MYRLFLALLACGLFLLPTSGLNAQEHPAVEAAEAWLGLVDGQQYAASWEESSRSFQSSITAAEWEVRARSASAQLGRVVERELARTVPVTDPPGAAAGEYVQLLFESTLSGIGRATENVVLTLDGERSWRVVGYFVQPPLE
jgi:hypothetical protein